ncbi:amino acid adenylation domain-containing protein [Micromonospora sp. NPDC047465]|uniref:non-ribosomal peptide synthetase n=1 Tax=Micromonospora sp. NPDC047465 TaxID=3154813 RepID=UPI0033E43C9D
MTATRGTTATSIPLRPPGRPAPLSFQQRRLWFLDRLVGRDAGVHNMAITLRLSGPLDVAALDQALRLIRTRHEALRTTIHDDGDEPVQVVEPVDDTPIETLDLTAVPDDRRPARLDETVAARAREPFDLRRPLIRTLLVRLAADEHVLLVTMHHIIADGWSGGVLAQELAEGYAALLAGRQPRLPHLPLQYPDFAAWQRAYLTGPVLERQLGYWRERLAGAPLVLDLPTDRPRPAVQSHRGATLRLDLPADLAADLQRFSRAEQVSPFMLGLAVFAVVLSRWSGQQDLVIGTPVANRTRPELEHLFGFFANTLALRTRLDGELTLRQLLDRVRGDLSADFAHQDVPFEMLVDALHPVRDLSRHPVFQTLFSWQDEPMRPFRTGELVVTPIPQHSGNSQFDLSFYAHRTGDDAVFCIVEYATDLFDADTVRGLADQFVVALRHAVADPDRPVARLPLLDTAQHHRVTVTWNDTAVPVPTACVHDLVTAQAARTPDAVALTCGGRAHSYRELDERAERLAHRLRAAGAGPGRLVGVCLPRGADLVVALLAVLRCGAAYLPLDPAHPAGRHADLLDDAAAELVVTADEWADRFPGRRTCPPHAPTDDAAPDTPLPRVDPDAPAYLLHTSGSTGRPKGVLVPHRAVVDFLVGVRTCPGLLPTDVVLAVSTICFDIALYEVLAPLTVGAHVVLANEDDVRQGDSLRRLVQEHRVTVLDGTPSTWRLLVGAGWAGGDLRLAVSTAEALTPELAEQLLDRCPEVWNMYGPTETTVWAAGHRVRRGERPVPIGRPTPNTRLYVLDAAGEPVPPGVPGELYVGGAGVAHGYLGAPATTAARFVPDPFGPPGARLYRTGDVVRLLPDGVVQYLGRSDNQVKLRGYRIELGEIEATLRRHRSVADVAVLLEGADPVRRHLVAYLVGRADDAPDAAELRSWCAATLPAYMVPARYVALPALPLNSNGKVDRRTLAQTPGTDLTAGAAGPGAPLGATARRVAEVWRDLLGRDCGPHENFFDAGGHSLLAVELQRTLADRFGVDVALLTIFEVPTIVGLATYLDAAAGPAAAAPAGAVPAIDAEYGRRRRSAHRLRPRTGPAIHQPPRGEAHDAGPNR